MEFYPDLCMPTDHLVDPYAVEYINPYLVSSQSDAEYEVRSTVMVDGGDQYGVSAVVFDKFEELIWMGNQGGHVTSYYGPTMQRYTSFQVHDTEEVRDLITLDSGLFTLTQSTLRHHIRRGLPKYTHRSDNMVNMQCLYQVGQDKLMMGGHQDKLLSLDLNKMMETVVGWSLTPKPTPIHARPVWLCMLLSKDKSMDKDGSIIKPEALAQQWNIPEDGCAVMRSGGGSVVACGSANGTVSLRDIRCPGTAQHAFAAHTACLSDLDMQGDVLITCGFTHSLSGDAVAEPYVIAWDVRQLRVSDADSAAWSLQMTSPPSLLHFIPAFSGRAVAVAGDGHVAMLYVNSRETVETNQSVFQVDTQNSLCSVMDVSATSQAFVFGDHSGHLNLFSARQNNEPLFNSFSRDTEFADPFPELPDSNSPTFHYTSIPLPPLPEGEKWLSDMPEEFFEKKFRRPRPIDPDILKSMKMQGPIGYAPNPRVRRSNEMPYIYDDLDDLNSPKKVDLKPSAQPIPKEYQKIDLKYNKHGPNDEIDNYNKTGYSGIEFTIPNSYCNSMLQVLYHTLPVKATLLAHTCAKEFCLSCELGFLFRMLDTSGGVPCQASNFLRAFRTVPEAAALGLILPDRGQEMARVDLIALIQSWNRFILHQMHYEILEMRKKEKALLAQNLTSPPKNRLNRVRGATPISNGQYEFYNEVEFGANPYSQEVVMDGVWPINMDNGESNSISVNDNNDIGNNQVDQQETEISELFAIGRHQLNKCLKCNMEEEKESVVLACALQYPQPNTLKESSTEPKSGFVELLLASLASKRSTPAWCENCKKFSPTMQRGRVKRLPPILAVNCGGVTPHEKAYWCKGTQKETEPVKKGGSNKPCRYGLHCARQGCRFKHPERIGTGKVEPEGESLSVSLGPLCVVPSNLLIAVGADGDISINHTSEQTEESTTKTDNSMSSKTNKSQHFTPTEENYALTGAVICVEGNPKNLVAYVETSGMSEEPQWHLFNDLSIVPVPAEEVVQFSSWWKTPCVLFYSSRRTRPEVTS